MASYLSSNALHLIHVDHLKVSFGSQTVLTDVTFSVAEQEIVTLIGPNGAGKSTLMRTILGLIKPTSGTVSIKKNIRIGYMPQKISVESFMPITVRGFLELAKFRHLANMQEISNLLGVEELLDTPIQEVSGGELQRVLLTRALLNQPDLLVLDEPVQGVDIAGQSELYFLIAQIRDQQKCGVLMISHDLHLVMAETDTVVCLNKHVCCSGHPESVSKHPEFLNLFGKQAVEGLAFYTHNHNHRHKFDGKIIGD